MPIPEERRKELMRETRSSAAAMLDDIKYLRGLSTKPDISADDIRRSAATLRRILIDENGDINNVAPPRIGRFKLRSFDNSDAVEKSKGYKYLILVSGKIKIYNFEITNARITRGDSPPPSVEPDDDMPEIEQSLDNFLSQPVICYEGIWINRRESIKYLAHVGHSVHSFKPKGDIERLLKYVRHWITVGNRGGGDIHISANPYYDYENEKPIVFSRNEMDVVSLQLLMTVQLLVDSPDIIKLEEYIAAEIG